MLSSTLFVVLSALAAPAPPSRTPFAPIAWAEVGATETEVDVIRLPPDDEARVSRLADRCEPRPDRNDCAVTPGDPDAPQVFAIGQSVAVVTDRGTLTLPVIGRSVSRGASEMHLTVRLAGSPAYAGRRGLALPADQLVRPTFLRGPAEILPGEGPLRDWRALVSKLLPPALTPAEKALLPDRALRNAKHVRVLPGRFGGPGRALVSVAVPADDTEYVSTVFLVDADAQTVTFVTRPARRLERVDPLYAVDLDGDGTDEAVVDSSYYEGAYHVLLRWDGQRFVDVILSGDGA